MITWGWKSDGDTGDLIFPSITRKIFPPRDLNNLSPRVAPLPALLLFVTPIRYMGIS